MDVLIISGNRESSPEPPYPLGCAYIAAVLKEKGHAVEALDLLFEAEPARAIEEKAGRADVVALSMRNLDLLTFPEMKSEVPAYAGYVERIRAVTAAPVVMGGSGFSLAPEPCLEAVGADVGIAGEAEEALPALLERIRLAGGVPDDVRGKVLRSQPGVSLDLVRPDFEAFDVRRYYEEGSSATVQTRRGCSLGCSYCSYPLLEGTRVRTRDPGGVAAEMALLRERYGVEHVTFVDSVFNRPEEHAIGVAEAVGRLDPPMRWTAFFHPLSRRPDFFRMVRDAGCEGLDLGVDSLSDPVLEAMNKGFRAQDVVAFCDGCRAAGLRFNLSLLFGAPGETTRSVDETIECVERCDPDSVTCGIGVRLYPGSRVTRELVRSGEVGGEAVGLETLYYLSEGVRDALVDMLGRVAERSNRWIIPGLHKNYNPRYIKRLRKHGRKGPIWHLVGS